MFAKRLLSMAGILSCVLAISAANAQTSVAFIGGHITYNWQNSGIFAGSPAYSWEGYGFKLNTPPGPCYETNEALSALQGIIASGKKPVIHLMVGADDAAGTSNSDPVSAQLQSFETCFANVVTTAQNAKLKILVGTNPFAQANNIDPYNKFIFAYCTPKGIPVIDYQTLLQRANDNFEGTEYLIPPPEVIAVNGSSATGPPPTISNKGYAIMNAQADRAIAQYVGGVTLKAGYLDNEYLEMNGAPPFVPGTSGNTVAPGTEMHWYAYGQYSDGITQQIANANVLQEYGSWTSSNPEVISIDPYGNAWALAPGTANIHFATLSGVTINEWTMNVDAVPVP
jgi:hypothetical protein